MPARHRERYPSSHQQLSTITPEFCTRCAGISVHVDLETLSTFSRNTHVSNTRLESCRGRRSSGEFRSSSLRLDIALGHPEFTSVEVRSLLVAQFRLQFLEVSIRKATEVCNRSGLVISDLAIRRRSVFFA